MWGSEDSDEDFMPRKKGKGRHDDIEHKVDELMNRVGELQNSLDQILAVTRHCRLPLGLQKALQEAFECSICKTSPVRPPVIVCTSCESILGCSDCINKWYSGSEALTKTCPKCRAERGYKSIMILKGMDSLLEVLQKIEGEDGDEESPSEPF